MTAHWTPCEQGQKLYDAFCQAMDNAHDSTTIAEWGDIADKRFDWNDHRDNCDKCKVKHDE